MKLVVTAANSFARRSAVLHTVADYPLGRIGSLRPGMVWGPGTFIVIFFVAITMFSDQELHRVRITRRDDSTMFTMISDLVQYIVLVESIFCFYCITVRPAIYLCL